jgi:vitamin-K-epoxide reductase (warfarin-sensitive)
MILSLVILALLGFIISLHLYIIELRIAKNPFYKPFCNISDKISCTKVLSTPYAKMFSVSNALVGMVFYAIYALLAILNASTLLLVAAVIACIASAIFAYILYVKIKTVCILCTSIYIINIALLIITLRSV